MGKKFCLGIQSKRAEFGFDCHLGFFFFLRFCLSSTKYLDENEKLKSSFEYLFFMVPNIPLHLENHFFEFLTFICMVLKAGNIHRGQRTIIAIGS